MALLAEMTEAASKSIAALATGASATCHTCAGEDHNPFGWIDELTAAITKVVRFALTYWRQVLARSTLRMRRLWNSGSQLPLIPSLTSVTNRLGTLDIAGLESDLAAASANLDALQTALNGSDASAITTLLTTFTGELETAGATYAALAGLFTSDRLPQLDLSKLNAVLNTTGATATIGSVTDVVQLAIKSQLPSLVTAGAASSVQNLMDYQASSLSICVSVPLMVCPLSCWARAQLISPAQLISLLQPCSLRILHQPAFRFFTKSFPLLVKAWPI